MSPKKNYKARAQNLRALGLLPKGYRINHLTESQKRQVRRVESRLKQSPTTIDILKNPGKYLFSPVDRADAEKLKERGHAVLRTPRGLMFYGERQHAQKLKFDKRSGTVIREYGNRINKTYPYDSAKGTLNRIERFFENRKRGEHLTMRIGDNSNFRIAIHSLNDFEKYVTRLSERWEERAHNPDERYRHDNPIGELQIVEIKKH